MNSKDIEDQEDVHISKTVIKKTPNSATFIAIHLAIFQQLCGINAVMAYGG